MKKRLTEEGGSSMKKPQTLYFEDDGRTPNSCLPTLLYRGVRARAGITLVETLEQLFREHDWPPQWRGGIYQYHHYHSRSHEALGVYQGAATLRLGGENGDEIEVSAGDVIVLPAGTGHCLISAGNDFAVTAAYPSDQQQWDLCVSGESDIDRSRAQIQALARPELDPVEGDRGGVVTDWEA